ncbi:hypothetical protein WG78_11910 [Amantichitinum ursilacus]|uniref:Uncharacterized protein n=1 Tax=Amantichitinum ursilacus TaxID=857265 RepID=A0A0N0XIA7_9NEIS|nr:hypothetical protein WG78_11910 [Amantichitinum ursilacus]
MSDTKLALNYAFIKETVINQYWRTWRRTWTKQYTLNGYTIKSQIGYFTDGISGYSTHTM